MRRSTVVAVIAVQVITGCGSDNAAPVVTTPETPASSVATRPSAPITYSTVVELRDAAVAAGFNCPSWKQDDVVKFAAESGTCSDEDVFATYATEAQRSEAASTAKELNQMAADNGLEPSPVLFGPNWSINTANAATLAKELGGTVVR